MYKLKRALYIKKQSPRAWFDRSSNALLSFNYNKVMSITPSSQDINRVNTLLIIYVDDIVILGDDPIEVVNTKKN